MRVLTDLKTVAIEETLNSIELNIINGIVHGKDKVSFTSEKEEFTNLIKVKLESFGYVVTSTFMDEPPVLYRLDITI